MGGGTDFKCAMSEIIRSLRTTPSGYIPVVIFSTDGEDYRFSKNDQIL